MPRQRAYTDAQLREAVEQSQSYANVARLLGKRPDGNVNTQLKRVIARLGFDTTHFTGKGWNRGQVSNKRKTASEVLILLTDQHRRTHATQLRNALIERGIAHECAECGQGPTWNNKPLTLAVDHINGDWWDNRQENVRFLCPNCHTQTSTYGSKRRPNPT